jgi:hypothetical protein
MFHKFCYGLRIHIVSIEEVMVMDAILEPEFTDLWVVRFVGPN